LEAHGREELPEGVDASRTVGWFTAIYPLYLEVGLSQSAEETALRVKQQLRKVPRGGIGYGILKHLSRGTGLQPTGRGIAFNYLGQFDEGVKTEGWAGAPERYGPMHSALDQRPYDLEINAGVQNGRLKVEWGFSRNHHRVETIRRLAEQASREMR